MIPPLLGVFFHQRVNEIRKKLLVEEKINGKIMTLAARVLTFTCCLLLQPITAITFLVAISFQFYSINRYYDARLL